MRAQARVHGPQSPEPNKMSELHERPLTVPWLIIAASTEL